MEQNLMNEKMHYYYAQINAEGICCGLSDLSGEVAADNMILLKSYDMSVMGKRWDGAAWQEVEQEPSDNMPLEEAVTLKELKELQLIQLEAIAEQYEQQEEHRLNDMEVQATIYETLLLLQEGGEA